MHSDAADLPELLTPEEVARLFRVSTQTVYRWGKAGTLPMVVVQKSHRFHRLDVERLLTPTTPAAEAV